MVGIEEFSRVVSRLHFAAGCVDDLWRAALSDITQCLDATACTLISGTGVDRRLLATIIPAEAASAYESYYHRLDFIVDACQSGTVGEVRSGWDLVADNREGEFYHDWQRRFDMTDGLLVQLDAADSTGFVVSAPPRDHPFANADRVGFVKALVPHLQHAVRTRNFLREGDLGPAELTAVADVIRHGVVVVTRGGRIATVNTVAERFLRAEDGLCVRGNVVAASLLPYDTALQATIARAVGVQDDRTRTGGLVVCGRPSGKRPYILRLVPLDIEADPLGARAAIVIVDPDRDAKPSKQLLRQLFGLTRAEIEVALRLLAGDGLAAIADDFSVSVGTVKTHVHRLFTKTGTHRQGELIRLLLSIVT